MAKQQQMIEVKITGYIRAADILDAESIQEQFENIDELKKFASEKLQMSTFKAKQVKKLIEDDEPEAEKVAGSIGVDSGEVTKAEYVGEENQDEDLIEEEQIPLEPEDDGKAEPGDEYHPEVAEEE